MVTAAATQAGRYGIGRRHIIYSATNASMAVAVFASPQNWTDPGRGIQLFGTCREVSDADAHDAEHLSAAISTPMATGKQF